MRYWALSPVLNALTKPSVVTRMVSFSREPGDLRTLTSEAFSIPRRSNLKIAQELRRRTDACHQQAVPSSGARDVKKVAFRGVEVFEVSLVSRRLDSLLKRNNFVIARHYHHGTEFKPLREMHRAYRRSPSGQFHFFIQYGKRWPGDLRRGPCTRQLSIGPHENPNLARRNSFVQSAIPCCRPHR